MVLAATDCHLEDNLRVAAVKAHLVGISRLGGAVSSLDMEALAFKRVQLTGVTFRTRAIHEKDAPIAVKRWWLGGVLALGGYGSESCPSPRELRVAAWLGVLGRTALHGDAPGHALSDPGTVLAVLEVGSQRRWSFRGLAVG
jgi:hypothetical protein